MLVFGHVHNANVDIGLYEGHCFHTKYLDVLANHWECVGCQQRFTHHDNYNRHLTERRCNGGQSKLVCNGRKFKHIMNSSEIVFYKENTQFSWKACKWIEHQSEEIGRHIHHTLCGHGGERAIKINKKEILVDGYDPQTSTVYQFYECKWHGCPYIAGLQRHCLESNSDKYHETINLDN